MECRHAAGCPEGSFGERRRDPHRDIGGRIGILHECLFDRAPDEPFGVVGEESEDLRTVRPSRSQAHNRQFSNARIVEEDLQYRMVSITR